MLSADLDLVVLDADRCVEDIFEILQVAVSRPAEDLPHSHGLNVEVLCRGVDFFVQIERKTNAVTHCRENIVLNSYINAERHNISASIIVMEFNLKTSSKSVATPQKSSAGQYKKKLWSQKGTISFKREDFIEINKLCEEKQAVLEELVAQMNKGDKEEEERPVKAGKQFKDLDICQHLQYKLALQLKYTTMTPIQELAFEPIANKEDVFIKSSTGSGKTLAFLVPILNELITLSKEKKITRKDCRLVIISPTRELSQQTEIITQQLINSTTLVCANISGGMNRESEKQALRKGANIICCTPGRL